MNWEKWMSKLHLDFWDVLLLIVAFILSFIKLAGGVESLLILIIILIFVIKTIREWCKWL